MNVTPKRRIELENKARDPETAELCQWLRRNFASNVVEYISKPLYEKLNADGTPYVATPLNVDVPRAIQDTCRLTHADGTSEPLYSTTRKEQSLVEIRDAILNDAKIATLRAEKGISGKVNWAKFLDDLAAQNPQSEWKVAATDPRKRAAWIKRNKANEIEREKMLATAAKLVADPSLPTNAEEEAVFEAAMNEVLAPLAIRELDRVQTLRDIAPFGGMATAHYSDTDVTKAFKDYKQQHPCTTPWRAANALIRKGQPLDQWKRVTSAWSRIKRIADKLGVSIDEWFAEI